MNWAQPCLFYRHTSSAHGTVAASPCAGSLVLKLYQVIGPVAQNLRSAEVSRCQPSRLQFREYFSENCMLKCNLIGYINTPSMFRKSCAYYFPAIIRLFPIGTIASKDSISKIRWNSLFISFLFSTLIERIFSYVGNASSYCLSHVVLIYEKVSLFIYCLAILPILY